MTPLSNKQVGERIRAIRENKNMTQIEVAEKLGMSKSNYAKYERGERKRFDREFLLQISGIIGVPVADIIGLDDDPCLQFREEAPKYGQQVADTDDLLNRIKDDPDTRMVAKISGDLTEEGKKDLLKYAELLRNQRDSGGDD